MNPRYPAVAERARYRCEYCQAPEAIFNLGFEVEHIVPTSRNGKDEASNWALACRSCNLHKSDHLGGFDEVTEQASRLFHPRLDLWKAHFRVDTDAGPWSD
ncbi:MAG: HNH endonuclease [Isosphaeraceae bacterium]